MSPAPQALTLRSRLAIIASALALLVLVMLLGGCTTPAKPAARTVAPLYTPGASGAKARPAPSVSIDIIHIRPEARDYVHP